MANAFSLTGDYHVNEVIGPANTLGQAGKNIRGCEHEAPLEMDVGRIYPESFRIRNIVGQENLEGRGTTLCVLINLHSFRTIYSDELPTFLTLHLNHDSCPPLY